MKALVTAEMPDSALTALKELGYETTVGGWGMTHHVMTEGELIPALDGVHLLVCELEPVTDTVFTRCPELAIVASCRGNPANVDLDAARRHQVTVLNTPGRNADSVADFTIGLLLALQRHILTADAHLRSTGWNVDAELPYLHFRGHELARTTIGLYGYGAVGRKVAQRLRDGFGSTILVHDPYITEPPDGIRLVDADDLFTESDVVSLHAPVTAETAHVVDAAQLTRLGGDGLLVNTARAELVDEADLIDALETHTIAGAALDVYWTEPLPRDHPLLSLHNVVITPHLAGAAVDVATHHAELILADLRLIGAGHPPRHAVVRPTAGATPDSEPPPAPGQHTPERNPAS